MPYTYRIVYDLNKDVWNWCDGCNSENFGVDWKTRVSKDIYKKINGKSKKEALEFLLPFLKQKIIADRQQIDDHVAMLEKAYSKNFVKACEKMVELTGQELYLNNFTFFITTFPRGPYNFSKGYIWEPISYSNPIAGFMHELLHFQFHHYWRDDPNSSIAKLSEDQFQYLKESLTVILDNDLVPLIERPDKGYDLHQNYRKQLQGFWKNNHDFARLIDYGVKILPDHISS